MSAADMQIVVTGDTSGATSALTALQGNLEKTAEETQKAGSEFQQLQAQLSRFKTAANGTLNPELLTIYNGKVKELEASMTALAQKEQLARIEAANSAVKYEEMSVAVNNTSVGATRLNAALSRATDPLQIAAREVNNFSRRLLYMVGSGVMGLAIGAFQAIVPAIEEFFTGLNKSGEAAQLTADNIQNLNDIMEDANKHAGEQIADLKVLYNAATNVNLAMKDRLAAAKELQKEFPDYFGNIKLETILNGGAKKSYDDLTASILENARAKAGLDKLQSLQGKAFDNEYAIKKAEDDFRTKVGNIVGDKFIAAAGDTHYATPAEQVAELRLELENQLAPLHLTGDKLNKEMKFITDIIGGAQLAKAVETQDTKKTKGAGKAEDPFKIDLQDLEDNYKDAQALDYGIKDYLLRDEEDFLQKKKLLLEKYGKYEGENNLAIAKNEQGIRLRQLNFIQSQQIQDLKPAKDKSLDPGYLATEKIGKAPQLFTSDKVNAEIKAMDDLNAKLAETGAILEKTLLPAFDALFTQLIEGGRKSGQTLGKVFSDLIKQLVLTFAKAAALAAIMSIFGGPTFGAALDKALGFSSKVFTPHAAGTTYSQGGLSLVGEHGPELVNLNQGASVTTNGQLNSIMGGSNVFIPNLTLRGSDMIVAFNRANATAKRNG